MLSNHPKFKGSGLDDCGRDTILESEQRSGYSPYCYRQPSCSHEGSHPRMRQPKPEGFRRGALSPDNHKEMEQKLRSHLS